MTPVENEGGVREIRVAGALMDWADWDGGEQANGPSAGWNLQEGSTFSPDASWKSGARVSHFTTKEMERYLPLCPDFIIEVRSKSDSAFLLRAKMQTWMENGSGACLDDRSV